MSSLCRAANVIRNHLEQKVLADEELSWAAFTVLFVLWIWGDQQRDKARLSDLLRTVIRSVDAD